MRGSGSVSLCRRGARGPIIAEFASVRVVASRERLPGPDVWLILRRRVGDEPDETPQSTFVRVWSVRWTIEMAFEDCKGELGMDQYEVRSWRAWHHHMTMTMLSHHLLVELRLKLGDGTLVLNIDFHGKDIAGVGFEHDISMGIN